jgi:hypothetical protein
MSKTIGFAENGGYEIRILCFSITSGRNTFHFDNHSGCSQKRMSAVMQVNSHVCLALIKFEICHKFWRNFIIYQDLPTLRDFQNFLYSETKTNEHDEGNMYILTIPTDNIK